MTPQQIQKFEHALGIETAVLSVMMAPLIMLGDGSAGDGGDS